MTIVISQQLNLGKLDGDINGDSPITRFRPPRVLLKLWSFIDKPKFDEHSCDPAVLHFGFKACLEAIRVAGTSWGSSVRCYPPVCFAFDKNKTHFCIASNSFNNLGPSMTKTSSIPLPGPGFPSKYMIMSLTSGEYVA